MYVAVADPKPTKATFFTMVFYILENNISKPIPNKSFVMLEMFQCAPNLLFIHCQCCFLAICWKYNVFQEKHTHFFPKEIEQVAATQLTKTEKPCKWLLGAPDIRLLRLNAGNVVQIKSQATTNWNYQCDQSEMVLFILTKLNTFSRSSKSIFKSNTFNTAWEAWDQQMGKCSLRQSKCKTVQQEHQHEVKH